MFTCTVPPHRMSLGVPSAFLPLLHASLMHYSLPLANWLTRHDYELYGKNDLRFLEGLYKVCCNLLPSSSPPSSLRPPFSISFIHPCLLLPFPSFPSSFIASLIPPLLSFPLFRSFFSSLFRLLHSFLPQVLRDVFHYHPQLTREQFLSTGFAERKILLTTDVLCFCQRKHRELVGRRPARRERRRYGWGEASVWYRWERRRALASFQHSVLQVTNAM